MANNRLAFGLCKEHGIKLPVGATPKDAWEALKEKGITQEEAYANASNTTKQGTSYEEIVSDESNVKKDKTDYEKAQEEMEKVANEMDNYKYGTPEYNDWEKRYDKAAREFERLQKQKYSSLRKDH